MARKRARPAISAEEQIARYAYVLGSVPASVADRAFAFAFAKLTVAQRRDVIDQLREAVPQALDPWALDSPEAFGLFMRSLYARSALVGIRGASTLAAEFVASPPVVAYFTVGVGSVSIDRHPPWVHDLARHETAPIDGGTTHHRKGATSGIWFD